MTTDIHTHLGTDRMQMSEADPERVAEYADTLVRRMDTFGIRRAVLTPCDPWVSNEMCMEATEIFPDRLFSACTVQPRPIDRAHQQLAEFLDRGCKALVLDGQLYHPEDPAVMALIRSAVDRDTPVYFHSENTTPGTTRFIERVSAVYPEGKFVILHMGGLFGFPTVLPLVRRHNIWLEVSVTLVRLVESPLRVFLDALVQDMGVRNLVFGSEHHSEYPDLMAALNTMGLNVETSRRVLQENAWVILGIDYA